MAARDLQLSRKSRGYVEKLNILKNVPVLNIFLVPEHQNFWDNEPVLISSKTSGKKTASFGNNLFIKSRPEDPANTNISFTE